MTIKVRRMTNRLFSVSILAAAVTAGAGCATGASDATGDGSADGVGGVATQPNERARDAVAGDTSELSIEQAIATLKELGYSDITDIGREGDRYCVEARDPSGKKVETFLDIRTGEIVFEEIRNPDGPTPGLSRTDVIARLTAQGYPKVSKIERDGDRYWVIASDADGKKFELHVSTNTGEIVRKERED